RNDSAFGKLQRPFIAVDVLPAEIPIGNRDDGADRTVWQCCNGVHAPTKVVRVRLDSEDIDINRKGVAVANYVVSFVRGDVDGLTSQPNADRRSDRPRGGEEESNADLDGLWLSSWLHVQLNDEVAAGFQAPRHALGFSMGDLARRVTQHVALWISGLWPH